MLPVTILPGVIGREVLMPNLLTRKLEAFGRLPEADRRLLDDAIENVRTVRAHEDLIREGERPDNVHLILEGFACRYKILAGGQRHIVAYLVPGDFCDLHSGDGSHHRDVVALQGRRDSTPSRVGNDGKASACARALVGSPG